MRLLSPQVSLTRATAETFLGDRDFILYTMISNSGLELSEDGECATFTREWVDETWREYRGAQNAPVGRPGPFPGSVKEFVEGYFKGALAWRDALTKRGREQRRAVKALREEWRETGQMQLGPTLAGILRRSAR